MHSKSGINPYNLVIARLKEREKELKCLYQVEEVLNNTEEELSSVFKKIISVIPHGWHYSTICEVRIIYDNIEYLSDSFKNTDWMLKANLGFDYKYRGEITVAYTQLIKEVQGTQFLPEEKKLLRKIADRLSNYLFFRELKYSIKYIDTISSNNQKKAIEGVSFLSGEDDEHWKWRYSMVLKIVEKLDFKKYGVKGVYLIGSVKNATAGPASDIDLMVHMDDNQLNKQLLKEWFEGWSLCLSEMNNIKTGYSVESGLIDLHIITSEDIDKKSSYATLIHSKYDRARPIKVLEITKNS